MATWSRNLGTDIRVPGGGAALPVTASGDLQLVTGEASVAQAMRRRTMTVPGSLVHRPDFGAGLPADIERSSSPGARAELAARIRLQANQDPRVSDVAVAVSAGVADEPFADGVTVDMNYQIARSPDDSTQTLTLAVTE